MKYRHEWKHEICYEDLLILRRRLSLIAQRDAHADNGSYRVRSLYFDNHHDKALREKIDGVNKREKFRIRYYNDDASLLTLEKKCKINGLCTKERAPISPEQVRDILHGRYDSLLTSGVPLIVEMYSKIMGQGLRPKIIVDYIREPFVFAPGNVRITLDHHLRIGPDVSDFPDPHGLLIPAGEDVVILEVKWDDYLPEVIRDAVQQPHCRVGAFSKYARCRIYG